MLLQLSRCLGIPEEREELVIHRAEDLDVQGMSRRILEVEPHELRVIREHPVIPAAPPAPRKAAAAKSEGKQSRAESSGGVNVLSSMVQ